MPTNCQRLTMEKGATRTVGTWSFRIDALEKCAWRCRWAHSTKPASDPWVCRPLPESNSRLADVPSPGCILVEESAIFRAWTLSRAEAVSFDQ